MVARNEEASFPRGRRVVEETNNNDNNNNNVNKDNEKKGRKRSASLDHSKQQQQQQQPPKDDFLFGASPSQEDSNNRKSKKHKHPQGNNNTTNHKSSSSFLPLGGGGVVQPTSGGGTNKNKSKQNEANIEALSFGKLAKGTKLLGIVRELQPEYAVLSLPNLLSGYVLKRESDKVPLTHFLTIGQVLAVSILKTATDTIGKKQQQTKEQVKRRRIQVSVLPSSMNAPTATTTSSFLSNAVVRGQIKSVEDHGCLVDLGHGRQGFLRFDDIQPDYTIRGDNDDNDDNDDTKHSSRKTLVLNPGRILDLKVSDKHTNSNDTKIVPLCVPSTKSLSRQLLIPNPTITLTSLSPGALVEARIEALARNGLCVTFLGGLFRGAIETSHLGANFMPSSTSNHTNNTSTNDPHPAEWKTVFGSVQTIKARILAVDAATKIVRLTLLPHLLNDMAPPPSTDLPPIGTVVHGATVIRLDPGVGALLALPINDDDDDSDDDEDDTANNNNTNKKSKPPKKHKPSLMDHPSYKEASKIRAAYVHISKAMDHPGGEGGKKTPESVFGKHFAISTTHTCRILSTSNWMEGVASCATSESVVEAHVLTHADLKPGKVYRNVPVSSHLEGGGVIVNFGMGVRGLIPIQHLFDTAVEQREGGAVGLTPYREKLRRAKFAIDAKVNVRVLEVDETAKRCILTAKKTLVQASATSTSVVTSYEHVVVGQEVTGFISNMDDRCLYVTFYNNVYGRVTARSLAAELGVEDHRLNYHVGDVVKCRVLNCRERKSSKEATTNTTDHVFWELNLSLHLNPASSSEAVVAEATATANGDSSQKERKVQLQAGAVIPPKCMKIVEFVKTKPKESGGFVPGYAIVSIKTKYIISEQEKSEPSTAPFCECKLPFDQLADEYSERDSESAAALDELAEKLLKIGKKINQRGLVVVDPKKSNDDYASGTGPLPVVSLRPNLIATADKLASSAGESNKSAGILLPTHDTHLYMGAYVQGYVTRIDPRYGAFVRFMNNLTGLVPKLKKGLDLPLFGTVTCRIMALDVTTRPMKILLRKAKSGEKEKENRDLPKIQPGDKISSAEIIDVNFARATVQLLDKEFGGSKTKNIRARIHVTMANSKSQPIQTTVGKKGLKKRQGKEDDNTLQKITKDHPFYKWKAGKKLSALTCVAVDARNGVAYVELSNKEDEKNESEETQSNFSFVEKASDLRPGSFASGVVSFIPKNQRGLWVQVCPGVSGYIPALELSTDVHVLNNLSAYYSVGARIDCCVMDKSLWEKKKRWGAKIHRFDSDEDAGKKKDKDVAFLSALLFEQGQQAKADIKLKKNSTGSKVTKPLRGDLIVGQINRSLPVKDAPALMLDLRGGFVGRCCITEVEEVDEWINMPLGRLQTNNKDTDDKKDDKVLVTDEENDTHDDDDYMDVDPEIEDDDEDSVSNEHHQVGEFPHGLFVQCRVLAGVPSTHMSEVSLRLSRIEGDIDNDEVPEAKDMIQAYVVDTNKKGCFVRLSRQVEGRVILKELCDGFLPDPAASYPIGRLVVGKIKAVREQSKKKKKHAIKAIVDLDMRESTLLESKDKLQIEDIEIGTKYKGTVARIETYGVFVRIDNSNVSGLVHKSECSDNYIKNLGDLYDPGDLVKVLVVKADAAQKRIGLSMKASHFENDDDSDDDSSLEAEGMDDDENSSQSDDEDMADAIVSNSDDDLDSDDENYATKLASKMETQGDMDVESDDDSDAEDGSKSSEEGSSDEESDDESDDEHDATKTKLMDTDVGFDWGVGVSSSSKNKDNDKDDSSSSEEESDDNEDEEDKGKSGHSSRRKAAARRREEQEITRRETALADGTADENPETANDFERLLASEPNRSETWIRYMAYHLSLADIQSARNVADRAFDRIEFRQEGEKLNVWTALLTLELKYGSPSGLQETVDRACQNNNPKKVYLRVCELLERDIDGAAASTETMERADTMFTKMCKKFKKKKTVWIAHLQYLLKNGRHQDAHALLKRSLKSLPEYKHIETMAKFAQLEFEHGSAERGRTVFDGILQKYPKRMDLLFVYVDKEVKNGEIEAARALFEKVANSESRKLSDKQMKSLFRKWYKMEEGEGTNETRDHVKNAAKQFIERTTKS